AVPPAARKATASTVRAQRAAAFRLVGVRHLAPGDRLEGRAARGGRVQQRLVEVEAGVAAQVDAARQDTTEHLEVAVDDDLRAGREDRAVELAVRVELDVVELDVQLRVDHVVRE